MNIDNRKEVRSQAPAVQGEGLGGLIMWGIWQYKKVPEFLSLYLIWNFYSPVGEYIHLKSQEHKIKITQIYEATSQNSKVAQSG